MRENYPHHSAEWMADAIVQKFGERLKCGTIRMKAFRMGLKVTDERLSEASKEHQVAQIGSIRCWNGFKQIRTENGWVSYGKYLIEQETGEKLPKDYVVMFIDGDSTNYDIGNLIAIPKGWQSHLNICRWREDMFELGVTWLQLNDLCKGMNRRAIRKEIE